MYETTRVANSQLNIHEFEQGKLALESYPQVLFIELTENCNFSCGMCRSAGKFQKEKNMSWDLFTRVADELFPYAKIVDLRGWGESTILRDFREFVDYGLGYGCQFRLVTNLSLENDELWKYLVDNGFVLAASFDAASPDTFKKLRHGSDYYRIVNNLRLISNRIAHSRNENATLSLIVTVQGVALGEMAEIVKMASDFGVSQIHFQSVTLPSDDPENLSNYADRLPQVYQNIIELGTTFGIETRFNTSLVESLANTEAAAKRCTHPWMYFYVNHQGEVSFCDHLIGIPAKEYLIGDLRQSSFKEIWNSPKYQELRRQHLGWRDGISDFHECNWCYRNRYIDFDELSYPPYAKHIVSNDRKR